MRHVAALIAFVILISISLYAATSVEKPGETVKIMVGNGHGSGFHIGDGYIVSAAHVVGSEKELTIKLDDGSEQSATVLWSNSQYDVALLRTDPNMISATLSCRVPAKHERVYAQGSPLQMEFLRTWGNVAGIESSIGPWKSAVPVDMTIIMGMSGGPVFDTGGRVIGVNIGVATAPVGLSRNITGIGIIVPAKSVCELLARS